MADHLMAFLCGNCRWQLLFTDFHTLGTAGMERTAGGLIYISRKENEDAELKIFVPGHRDFKWTLVCQHGIEGESGS